MRSILVLTALAALAGAAVSAPTVYFEPAQVQVEQGETFYVGVRIDAAVDTLTCFLVEFTFDPEVVELLSAVEGTLFAGSGVPTMFDWDILGPGLHSCNDVTLGFENYVLCPGELVHLEFYALAEGVTPITITAVDLRDIRREPILPVLTGSGMFTVGPGTGVADDEGPGQNLEERLLTCFPNPFAEGTDIELSLGGFAVPATVTVYGPSGRVVWRSVLAGNAGGTASCSWDGRRQDGLPLPAGVYFLEARHAGGRARGRVTLVR